MCEWCGYILYKGVLVKCIPQMVCPEGMDVCVSVCMWGVWGCVFEEAAKGICL